MSLFFTKTKIKQEKRKVLNYKDQVIEKIGREQLKELAKKGLDFKIALL